MSIDIPSIIDCINSFYIKFNINKEEQKSFLEGVFFENGISEFVAKFIYDIFENSINDFVFTASEYNKMSFKMFKMVCEKENNINIINVFWSYTYYFRTDSNGRVKVRNKEAYSFLINYIKINYTTVLPQLIEKDFNNCVYISNLITHFWTNRNAFISFINDLIAVHKDDKRLKEFSEFMNKFYDQKKLAPIEFGFKYIQFDS